MTFTSIWQRAVSRGTKGALALISGSVFGQLITLAITPILARLYSSTDFGYLSLVLSAASIAAPAAALRLESALMLPRSNRDAFVLLSTGGMSAAFLSVLTAATLEVIFSLGMLENMAKLPGFSLWVGAIVFLTATFTLLSQAALRHHAYRAVALRTVYQSTLSAGSQLGLGFIGAASAGLIGGYALGRIAGILPLALTIRADATRFHLRDVTRLLRQYWRFPAFFTPSAVLNSAGLMLPLLFLGSWFSVADAGQWAMADRLLAAPLVLIATAVGQVVEAHLAEAHRENQVGTGGFYLKVSAVLAAISMALVLLIVFAAPPLIPFFLGPGWDLTIDLILALTPMLATRLVASPMSKVLLVAQHGALNLGLDALRLVVILAAIAVTMSMGLSVVEFAWSVSFAFSGVYLVTWLVGWVLSRRSPSASTVSR